MPAKTQPVRRPPRPVVHPSAEAVRRDAALATVPSRRSEVTAPVAPPPLGYDERAGQAYHGNHPEYVPPARGQPVELVWPDLVIFLAGTFVVAAVAIMFLTAHGALDQAAPQADEARTYLWMAGVLGALAVVGGGFLALQRSAWALAGAGAGLVLVPWFMGAFRDYSQPDSCGFWVGCTSGSESSTTLMVIFTVLIVLGTCAGIGFAMQGGMRKPVASSVFLFGALALTVGLALAAGMLVPQLEQEAATAAASNAPRETPGLGAVGLVAALGLGAVVLRRGRPGAGATRDV